MVDRQLQIRQETYLVAVRQYIWGSTQTLAKLALLAHLHSVPAVSQYETLLAIGWRQGGVVCTSP